MDVNFSAKNYSKSLKRKKNIEQLNANTVTSNNNLNEILLNNIIHEISDDDNSENGDINIMAKNKRKGDKFYINCYSKIIERLKFQIPEEEISTSKKIKINESLDDTAEENSIPKSNEIISIKSISSCKISDNDINCIVKTSSYSSSELIDSSQSLSLNKIPLNIGIKIRPMLKNTIPSDCFQKFLDSLEKKYKKLSSEDKVMSWDYSSDISEVEDVINFEERRKLLKLFYRENNNNNNTNIVSTLMCSKDINLPIKKLLRSSRIKICNNNNDCNIITLPSTNRQNSNNNKLIIKNDEILKQIINSPKMSPSSTKSGWSTDYNKDDKLIIVNNNVQDNVMIKQKSNAITSSSSSPTKNNKLIQIRKDYGTKLNKDEIFKIPNVPRKYLPLAHNKIESCDQKEEFYKYLGLGTKSSENENYNSSSSTNAAAAAELKRRSLRVRRLQLYQQNNIKKITEENCMNVNEITVKANGQLRLHQSDKLETIIPTTTNKRSPKIQIICSVNSNAKNKNIKMHKQVIPDDNDKNVQNKSIISEKINSQTQLNDISHNNNNNINSKKQLDKRNISFNKKIDTTVESPDDETSSSLTNLSQKEYNNSESENSESLIICKRSYQQAPIPNKCHNNVTKRITPIIIPIDNNRLKNDLQNKFNHISNLSQNKINEKSKIKIEFATDYRTKKVINNKNNLIGIEKSSQTFNNNNNSILYDTIDIETSMFINNNKIKNYSTTNNNNINNITDDTITIVQEPKKYDIIDINKTRCSTPSECKVIIEKLTDKQINNEFINKNNKMNENNKIVKNSNDQQNFVIKSKKNRKIWTKSKKLKIRRTNNNNLNQSRILRNKKIIKIIKKPINISDKLRKIRKERKNSEKSINLHGPAKIAKMMVMVTSTVNNNNSVEADDNDDDDDDDEKDINLLENINNNIKTSIQQKTENNIKEEEKPFKKINDLDLITQNLLPNPLKFEKGDVLHAYYECELLIVVQEFLISFWKYSKVIQMLGEPQEWEFLGECKRKLIDEEIMSPYKNRICINDTNPVYIELRARQLPNDNRECNLASPYINIYYFDIWTNIVSQHSIQLDTIKCLSKFIAYTTIVNSRYFIMCWKQDTILGTQRTGLCKYALTPDLETLASIRDFKNLRHIVYSLECCDEDKLIGFGETQITIWDHRTGDVLTNFDLGISIGKNLGSLISSIEFEEYLFIYQLFYNEDTDDLPELKIFAITTSLNTPSFRQVQSHELPLQFISIKSSLNTYDYFVITAITGEEIWMLPHHPQRLLYMNEDLATSSKRFYSTASYNFIEITGDYLNVKKIHENLLNIIT